MSSYYSPSVDESSDIYSLYSHPMTRLNTAECSESVQTPTDVLSTRQQQPKHGVVGPRSMNSRKEDGMVRVHAGVSDPAHIVRYLEHALDMVPEMQEMDAEPDGPYFSIPVKSMRATSKSNGLQRRKSTKELIDRFESLDTGKSNGL